ncbi:MAG TPA: threonine/serine dehydratase [Candidatus Avanaerovorax faecigallinarum]|nr:threonine/serine dehydratase [Candidatus Avanaerovorax faecigallinarum]
MAGQFGIKDVREAYERIKPYVYKTPLEESLYLGKDERRYFFKLECAQTVKSFKIRGAISKMSTLTEEERKRGAATISSGNHGASVSYGAKLLGIEKAVVIVPETTPKAKVDKIRFYGAEALLMGKDYDEAHKLGMEYIEENKMTYIDAYYDDPKIYGGQGTIGLEILEQRPEIDTIVVPIGGGGLITGIAAAAKSIKPDIRIIGVQTEACPAMIRALEDKVFYDEYPVTGDTICDALVGGVGKLSYEILGDYVDDIIMVREKTIRKAVRYMIKEEKYIAEGASASTVAAVMDEPERVGGKNIALVISGGNIDGELMMEILNEREV